LLHAVGHRLGKDDSLNEFDAAQLHGGGRGFPYSEYSRLDGRHSLPAFLMVRVVNTATDARSAPQHLGTRKTAPRQAVQSVRSGKPPKLDRQWGLEPLGHSTAEVVAGDGESPCGRKNRSNYTKHLHPSHGDRVGTRGRHDTGLENQCILIGVLK